MSSVLLLVVAVVVLLGVMVVAAIAALAFWLGRRSAGPRPAPGNGAVDAGPGGTPDA